MENEQSAPREANKICGVCGDKALGYNFSAVSCESCKAFFRRNALKNKGFQCLFTENCKVTPLTRRFCQKCRLDKCFSIGMRKEYIMSEEDKVIKRKKIEKNRVKRRLLNGDIKRPRMKREIVDDTNFDDTSVSVNSVASTISETFFWESNRKYADLDANRQPALESMSPVTAASVPSPSSPPENHDIIGAKMSDILTESIQGVKKNSDECHNDFQKENIYTDNYEKIVRTKESGNCSKLSYQKEESCDTSMIENDGNSDDHSSCLSIKSKIKSDAPHIGYRSHENNYDKGKIESSEEIYSKLMNVVSKLIKCPDFVVKLVSSHPSLIGKILQDKNAVTKFINDPDVIATVMNDPLIAEFIETDSQSSNSSSQNKKIPNNIIRVTLEPEQNNIEHPTLTNLITSSKSVENSDKIGGSNINNTWSDTYDNVARDVLQDVRRIPITMNSIESILCQAIKLEFSAYSTLGGNQNHRELNDSEKAKLNELIVANKALLAPLDDDITNLVRDERRIKGDTGNSNPMLLNVINLSGIAIRRIVKMSKKINAFKNMCQEDQLALFKGGCIEMMMLRSVLSYDPAKHMWKIPHSQESMSEIKADILKMANGNLYTAHERFVRTFDSHGRDENIILILTAIALFTPDRQRVVHSDVIKLEQNSYYYLLRRYLESVYPGCEAKSTFLKLIQKISELQQLSNEVVGVYLNVNPSSIEPLLKEIFDLEK